VKMHHHRMPYGDNSPSEQSPLNPSSFNGSLKDFTGLKIIGKGTYGKVYRALRTADNKEYAIKELNLGSMTAKERQDALNEVRVLASLDSSANTIRYGPILMLN
jgi:serine/threonine protein kinase